MSWPMPNQAPWTAGIAGMPPNNMNMGSYTPEQWAAMQQQNWQQWTQWQQQYTQWQNQYGAKYSQMQGTFPMNNVPPPPSGGPAPPVPPPPDQPPPPPPPHENNQPLYGNNLPGSQPPQRTNYSNTIPTTGNTQWPTNTDTTTNQSQPSVNSEALKKLAEEERLFDIQFKKWEEEIDKWRKENVNHPDKQAYKEYEQRFEQCRTQLLERREQMKKNRDKLMGTPSQPVPVTAPSQNANPVYKQQPQPQSQNNSQYQNFDNSYGNSNNKNIDPQDRYESYPNESFMENFNDSSNNSFLTTSSSTKGIPGLDLVPELSKNIQDVVDITDDEKSKQAPDYSTISKGIKNILGDEKIMNILSMVRKDVGSTLEQNAQFQGNQNYQNAPPIQDNQNFGRQNAPYNRQGPNQPQYGQGDSQYSAQQDQYYDANTQHGGPNNFGNQNKGILGPRPDGSLLGPGNPDLRQGGPNRPMGPHGGPNVRPSGPQGVSNVRPGGPQGGNNMRPGGPPGGHNMRPGGPQGGPNVRSGAPNNRQNGPNGPRHGGPNQNMQHGGSNQHMQQGGPNQNNMQHSGPNQHMQHGGPNQHLQQSGPNQHMQQGVSNQHMPQGGPNHRMTQGGPNMRPGAQNMRHPGPIMRPPGPNIRPSGPGPQGPYNNGPRPLMQTPVQRPPLEDISSQQNTNNYYGEQEMPPENVAPVVSQPSRPKWDHEPMFNPSIVVEYEHKPLRLKARDFIEPVHTFDYNHTSKDGDTKKKDFEKEVEELFSKKPKRVTDRDDEDRYSKDLFYRDDRRSGRDREREREYRDRPRDENREEHWRERPREEHIDRRKDLRYDDRRREDFDRHRDDKDRRERDDFRDRRREEDYSRRDRDEPSYLRDRNRDFRRDDNRNRSRSRDRDSRKRGVSRESEISNSSAKKSKEAPMLQDKKHVVMIDDLLELPGREMRPEKIVLILRGPPGSGKTYLAKLIRDREAELGGTVRIMSIDDYFMQEGEIEEKDPVTGKIVKKPTLKYEYDAALEDTYITSLKRAFKRSITDGYFSFLIYDAMNDQLKSYADIWNFARQNGFQVYVCTMDLDPQLCHKRNIHNRSLEDIEIISSRFFPTPLHHIQLDPTTLLQNAAITDVQMEDVENEPILDEPEVESVFTSKWEKMDDATQLARLDGTSKPLRPSQYSMEDYLQLDEWTPNKAIPGKKSVRWADIEERREQEKMRAIGFVVGQTDWNRMTDPTMGSSALTQTKYIERVRRNQ